MTPFAFHLALFVLPAAIVAAAAGLAAWEGRRSRRPGGGARRAG